ncbi:hypothetical protein R1sor_016733 [Riccia sorocarpa]|uniref:Uncharacterized protein n=1 Tax=Riccia sorocarpa TaxID=122646 RepID=A0ABD3HM37_9MARC
MPLPLVRICRSVIVTVVMANKGETPVGDNNDDHHQPVTPVTSGKAVCQRKLCPSAESSRFSAEETDDFSAEEEEADDLSVEEELPTRSNLDGPVFAKAYTAFKIWPRGLLEKSRTV